MASDPAAWSIEILPASVRKKREFVGGQLFLIFAAALALAYLGWSAWTTSTALKEVRVQAAGLDQQYKKASSTHRKTEELVAENKKLAAAAERLIQVKGSGEQLARTITFLQSHLPQEFWVTKLGTDWRADPQLRLIGNDKRPVVSIEGKSREGQTNLSAAYGRFVEAVKAKLPPDAPFNEHLSPTGSRFTVETTVFAPKVAAPKTEPEPEAAPTPKKAPH